MGQSLRPQGVPNPSGLRDLFPVCVRAVFVRSDLCICKVCSHPFPLEYRPDGFPPSSPCVRNHDEPPRSAIALGGSTICGRFGWERGDDGELGAWRSPRGSAIHTHTRLT
jgi:hypothetical protein